MAERLALSKLAVVPFSSTGDPEVGDYDDEPTVFFRKGQLPAAFHTCCGMRLVTPWRPGRAKDALTVQLSGQSGICYQCKSHGCAEDFDFHLALL
jgi:hypothetical protein